MAEERQSLPAAFAREQAQSKRSGMGHDRGPLHPHTKVQHALQVGSISRLQHDDARWEQARRRSRVPAQRSPVAEIPDLVAIVGLSTRPPGLG